MRLPRPRFTILRLMIAVAVVAVVLGIATWVRDVRDTTERSRRYRQLADQAEQNWSFQARLLDDLLGLTGFGQSSPEFMRHVPSMDRAQIESMEPQTREFYAKTMAWRRRLDYYAALRDKYRRAAAHPWESMVPDPPEPE